jgi:uncharacterized protein
MKSPPRKPQQLYSWMNPKLEIRETGKIGKGVFVKTGTIEKDEMLFVMGGSILTIEDENNLSGVVEDKPIEISEYFSIGPRNAAELKRMPQHYVNHSCNPNAGFKGQIFMVAMREIMTGEDIAYDYAMVMHSNPESTSFFTMQCLCGQPNCRGVITEDDWQRPELQHRYNGYFQWFLQEKLNAPKQISTATQSRSRLAQPALPNTVQQVFPKPAAP